MKRLTLTLVFLPLLGCAGQLQTPAGPYVKADHLTYDAVAPEYSAYVESDQNLDDAQKARRGRTVRAWKLRIDKAEQNAAATTGGAR